MKTDFLIDNLGNRVEYIKGLKDNSKLLCIRDVMSTGDGGDFSFTFEYTAFKKSVIYNVDHIYNWNGHMVAYVSDGECLHWATPNIFKPL